MMSNFFTGIISVLSPLWHPLSGDRQPDSKPNIAGPAELPGQLAQRDGSILFLHVAEEKKLK
jgi:hypothetical protein